MKGLAIALISVFAIAYAADAVKIDPKFTKGDTQSYKVKMTMDVGGTEAEVSFKRESKVAEVGEKITLEHSLRDLNIMANGETMEVPYSPLTIVQTPGGIIHKAEGGVAGTDPYHMAVISQFFAPKEEIEKDKTWKEEIAKIEGVGLNKLTVEGTYLGPDTEVDKAGHKFKIKVVEAETGFECESTFWVDVNGKTLKQEGTFKALPVPVTGSDADGKIKVEKS